MKLTKVRTIFPTDHRETHLPIDIHGSNELSNGLVRGFRVAVYVATLMTLAVVVIANIGLVTG